MKYEELYAYTGDMGPYQWGIFAAVFVFSAYCADAFHMVFIGADMDHWCRVEELEGLPADVQKRVAIPGVEKATGDGGSVVEYSQCEMYSANYSSYNYNDSLLLNDTRQIVPCTDGWIYDTSTFQSTIVSRFDLVCGLGFLRQMATTVFMAGFMTGGFLSGIASDRFGRKSTMIVFCCVKLCGNALSIFGPNYAVFVTGRFIIGLGQIGYYLPGFILVMEYVGPKYRTVCGCLQQLAFAIGFMMQPAIAYALRDDFSYQIAATAPILAFPVVMIFFIPESIRWLLVNNRPDEARRILQRICAAKGTKLPDDLDLRDIDIGAEKRTARNCSSLLVSPTLRWRTILIDFSWFTCSLIYFALSLSTGSLAGNIYLNTFISGTVEIPAYILAILMMGRKPLGRRWTGFISLAGAGIFSFLCIPALLTDQETAATVLSMCGKAFISIAYSVVFVFASEIFPTEVRNIGMSTGNMFSMVSSMAAAYIGGPLAEVWKPLPSLIFGILATVSGLSYIFLPETLGQPLPDTVDEAEQQDKRGNGNLPCMARSAGVEDSEKTRPRSKRENGHASLPRDNNNSKDNDNISNNNNEFSNSGFVADDVDVQNAKNVWYISI